MGSTEVKDYNLQAQVGQHLYKSRLQRITFDVNEALAA